MREVRVSAAPMVGSTQASEDAWVPSVCGLCSSQCGILVHRVDGVVTKIEGNPRSPLGRGRLCARGLAGIQLLYDPSRVNHPLRRTNPEKGIGVDPQWERIAWDEAMDAIVERLERVRSRDPGKLLFCGTPVSLAPTDFAVGAFMPAFGSPHSVICDGQQCGSAEPMLARTLRGAATSPDFDHCEYFLMFGSSIGAGGCDALTTMAQKMGDARVRGMKMVAVAPYLSPGVEKADEWLPIRPGSEGALACAFLNLLLNEYGLFDAEYVRHHTDGPYLVAPDGGYARDPASRKPLVWDVGAGCARPFDDGRVSEAALEGAYDVEGKECKPGFQLLKEQVAKWTPEAAAEVTTLSADTIRRIARGFGEAARLGSTIAIEGKELPLRPAAAIHFGSADGHDNGWPTYRAVDLLNEVVGASNVPGGLRGPDSLSYGYPETGMPCWGPQADNDGLLRPGVCLHNEAEGSVPGWSWLGEPNLSDYRPEVLIDYGSNLLASLANSEAGFEALKDCFVISFGLYCDENAEALADIVLPEASYLERLDPVPNCVGRHFSAGPGDWAYQIRQPAVEPLHERRPLCEVLLEIAERVGFSDAVNTMINRVYDLKPPHLLDPEGRYSWEEIADNIYKSWFGPERGLPWFRENGVLTWPKRPEEAYCRPFTSGRIPLCWESLPPFGERSGQALVRQEGYDLQAVSYCVPWHTISQPREIPWLEEVSRIDSYISFVCINTCTAEAKGIEDGDRISVESASGRRLKGRARLTEGVHPEVVAIADNGGLEARDIAGAWVKVGKA